MIDHSHIERNLSLLREEISRSARRLGTPPATLVCVTKSGSDEQVLALARFGATDLAENRPQELVRRAALLRAHGFSPRMHQIGNLQKNKVKPILRDAELIHSLDSLSLAQEIDRVCARENMRARVLIEINSGKEANKGGIAPEDALRFYEQIRPLSHLDIFGMMTMAPRCQSAAEYRPYFRLTKQLFDTVAERYGYDTDAPVLSMGMTDSYAVAIEEGATLVRVGRKLFSTTEEESQNV